MVKSLLLSKLVTHAIVHIKDRVMFFFYYMNKTTFLLISNTYIYDLNTRVFTFFFNSFTANLFKISSFFRSWHLFSIRKIKFRHRVTWFKLLASLGMIIRFNLGLSHYTYVRLLSLRLFRRKKYLSHHSMVFWGSNSYILRDCLLFIKKLQPISPYCLRGFKFARDRYIKRPGKMSKYTHLKGKLF